jgi:hypothetical protein
MRTRMTYFVAVGFAIFACSTGSESRTNDDVSGTYVREYSFKVINPETGIEVGVRTVRDTIFIQSAGNGYEISNNKWKLNDYDKEGWQSMAHSDDRPIPLFTAALDSKSISLISAEGKVLHFELNKESVYWREGPKYKKVNL